MNNATIFINAAGNTATVTRKYKRGDTQYYEFDLNDLDFIKAYDDDDPEGYEASLFRYDLQPDPTKDEVYVASCQGYLVMELATEAFDTTLLRSELLRLEAEAGAEILDDSETFNEAMDLYHEDPDEYWRQYE